MIPVGQPMVLSSWSAIHLRGDEPWMRDHIRGCMAPVDVWEVAIVRACDGLRSSVVALRDLDGIPREDSVLSPMVERLADVITDLVGVVDLGRLDGGTINEWVGYALSTVESREARHG